MSGIDIKVGMVVKEKYTIWVKSKVPSDYNKCI